MDKLTNFINQVKLWFKTRKNDLGIVVLIILIVLLLVGQWRLEKIVPKKEPVKIEGIE